MSKITLSQIKTTFDLSDLNRNFTKLEDALNNQVLYRSNPEGEQNNMVRTNIDMDSNDILNVQQLTVLDKFSYRGLDFANIHGDLVTASEKAVQAANRAENSEEQTQKYQILASNSATQAAASADNANTSANTAKGYAENAAISASKAEDAASKLSTGTQEKEGILRLAKDAEIIESNIINPPTAGQLAASNKRISILEDSSQAIVDIAQIKTDVATNKTNIASLKTTVESHSAEATAKWVTLNNLENSVNNITPRLSAVETATASNTALIANISESYGGIQAILLKLTNSTSISNTSYTNAVYAAFSDSTISGATIEGIYAKLPAGTYTVNGDIGVRWANTTATSSKALGCRIYNATKGVSLVQSLSIQQPVESPSTTTDQYATFPIHGIFTLTETSDIYLQARSNGSGTVYLGTSSLDGVYAAITILRIA